MMLLRPYLKATKNAVANDLSWNWQREQFVIEQQGADFIAKNPELSGQLSDRLFANWQKVTETLTLGERPTTGINRFGAYFRGPHSVREPIGNESKAPEQAKTDGNSPPRASHTGKARGWNFYDTTETTPPRWLVKGLMPETGVGILAGQWGSFKTTAALDLSLSVMTGTAFASQYRVKRKGAVLYFAVEGSGTLKARLEAIARYRGAPEKLPFAWRGECPLLTAKDAGQAIVKCVDEAAVHFEHAYGLPITLIWIDTYVTAAGLSSSGDDNDVAATQKAFTALRFVASHSGAFIALVDHYGKVLEAGTRGSSRKEGSADTVLGNVGRARPGRSSVKYPDGCS